MKKEWLWTEVYRPQKVEDCVLPERLKKLFQKYADDKLIPNLILSGTPGIGKTTVAKAMCEEAGISYMFINSSKERGIDVLRTKITTYASTTSLVGGKKVLILDEADGLTPEAQNALRGAIDAYSTNCTFILTCNFKGKIIEALHSRTSEISFQLRKDESAKILSEFFRRLQEILVKENVEFDRKTLVEIIKKYSPDFRKTLGELQRYYNQFGKIDAAVLNAVSDLRNISELVGYLKTKDFKNMRKWVAECGDIDPTRIYRNIYDSLDTYLEPSSIPQAVLILGKYQVQAAFVSDQEINAVAAFTELMIDCNYL